MQNLEPRSRVNPIHFFGINYIKIDVIQGKIQLVESNFDVIHGKICFIGLTPGQFKNRTTFCSEFGCENPVNVTLG